MMNDHEETRTPRHDAIVYWLHLNAAKLAGLDTAPAPWTDEEVDRVLRAEFPRKDVEGDRLRAELRSTLPAPLPLERVRRTWEYELVRKSPRMGERVVGYIDLAVFVHQRALRVAAESTPLGRRTYLAPAWHVDDSRARFYEVKPTIPSLGGLIRQLRRYRRALGADAKIYVVSPDSAFEDLIKNQGFEFLKSPDIHTISEAFG